MPMIDERSPGGALREQILADNCAGAPQARLGWSTRGSALRFLTSLPVVIDPAQRCSNLSMPEGDKRNQSDDLD